MIQPEYEIVGTGWLKIRPIINNAKQTNEVCISPLVASRGGKYVSLRTSTLYSFLSEKEAEQLYEHLKKELGK